MKTLSLVFGLALSLTSWAADTRLHAIGVGTTDMEFVTKIHFKEKGWSGVLDCQSFFNHLLVNGPNRDANLYLDGSQCEDWRDTLRDAGPGRPQCFDVNLTITPVACASR